MNENRLADYLEHIHQAATDARSFVDGMSKEAFLDDKRTQRAVIMSLIIMGEAATKVIRLQRVHSSPPRSSMAQHPQHAQPHGARVFRHQPRYRVGDRPGVATHAAGAATGHTQGRRQRYARLRMTAL